MSTCEAVSIRSRSATLSAIATRAVAGLAAFLRAWRNRRAFYRLGELTDAELADIGLTRADLHVAIDVPFGGDPTVKLCALASRRTAADLTRAVG